MYVCALHPTHRNDPSSPTGLGSRFGSSIGPSGPGGGDEKKHGRMCFVKQTGKGSRTEYVVACQGKGVKGKKEIHTRKIDHTTTSREHPMRRKLLKRDIGHTGPVDGIRKF